MSTSDILTEFTKFRMQLKATFSKKEKNIERRNSSNFKEKLKLQSLRKNSSQKKESIISQYLTTSHFNPVFYRKVSQDINKLYQSESQLLDKKTLEQLSLNIEVLSEDQVKQIPKEYVQILTQLAELINYNIK